MKDKQYNGKKNKNKRTNNYLQNITQKTKDGATWTPLKTGDELGAQEGPVSSCSICNTRRETVNDMNIIWYGNRVGHQYN